MKEVNLLYFPPELFYTKTHEWAKSGDTITIGITDYAQNLLGDIVYVELPEVGSTITKGEELGTVESVKAVSEIYAPVSGEVVQINEALADDPALVNQKCYTDGWFLKVKAADPEGIKTLLDKAAYFATLTGE